MPLWQSVTVLLSTSSEAGELAVMMEQMAKKGLLFRKRDEDRVRYAAVPYVVGIFEFQVNAMDEAFARDVDKDEQDCACSFF